MDGGPFRASRPAERQAASRSEPIYRQPDEPQPSEKPQVSRTKVVPARPDVLVAGQRKQSNLRPIILTILAILAVLIGGWYVWTNTRSTAVAIDADKYQAVFFTNGQVYFGKLQQANQDYLKLTDIYYLQTQASDTATNSENPQETGTSKAGTPTLVKLGGEVHGPEDMMMIAKGQILFYENLKSDGTVSKSIQKEKTQTQ